MKHFRKDEYELEAERCDALTHYAYAYGYSWLGEDEERKARELRVKSKTYRKNLQSRLDELNQTETLSTGN